MPPKPTRVLINGAGVAGPAFAALLLSSSRPYAITVVERAESLRRGGQQIDLRSHGLTVAKRMGVLSAIKSRCVTEKGIAFVDKHSKIKVLMGVNDSGRGEQTLSSQYEIMRGDLVDVFYQASLEAAARIAARTGTPATDTLRYEFGKHATAIRQQDASDPVVDVVFSDDSKGKYDLMVAADGQGSRTRRLAFGEEASRAAFRSLGVYSALFSAERDDAAEVGGPHLAKMYHATGRRTLATRVGDAPFTQVALSTMRPSERLVEVMARGAEGIEEQKREFERLFRGAGWQEERLLKGLHTTDDFYSYVAGQVKMETWSRGRVVVLGDAGYCPSPMSGMGTTCALVGSYVLAGELSRNGTDIDAALQAYEKVARPFIDEAQQLPESWLKWWFRDTELQIRFFHFLLGVITRLSFVKNLFSWLPERKERLEVPAYPELDFLSKEKA